MISTPDIVINSNINMDFEDLANYMVYLYPKVNDIYQFIEEEIDTNEIYFSDDSDDSELYYSDDDSNNSNVETDVLIMNAEIEDMSPNVEVINNCELCYNVNLISSVINNHKSSSHSGDAINCNVCSKMLFQPLSQDIHTTFNHGEGNNNCTDCNYKSILNIPYDTHTNKNHKKNYKTKKTKKIKKYAVKYNGYIYCRKSIKIIKHINPKSLIVELKNLPAKNVVDVTKIDNVIPILFRQKIIFLIHFLKITVLLDEPSDNIFWSNVLDTLNEKPVKTVANKLTVERGNVYCKNCIRETVHICIEDTLLILNEPDPSVKMLTYKRSKKLKNGLVISKTLSFKMFKRSIFKSSATKIEIYRKKKIVKLNKIANNLRIIKARKSRKLFINIIKYKLNKNFPKSVYLKKLLYSDIAEENGEENVTLKRFKHSHPLIYPRGVQSRHMTSIMNYMCKDCRKMSNTRKIICKHMAGDSLKYLRKVRNRKKRSINGNRNVIKLTAWNKGGMDLEMKIDEIKVIIEEKKPQILIVNELNLNIESDYNITNIKGYNFEIDQLYEKNGIGRTGMWIDENMVYERVKTHENDGESIVVIKVGYFGKRRFTVTGYYRQWSNVFYNKNHEKISNKEQDEKFHNQLKELVMMNNSENIIMGDFNVNYNIINKCEKDKSNYEKTFNNRLKSIQSNLLSNNFKQIIADNTRNESILDHIYTNNTNKIHRSYTENDSSSDHCFINLEKKMLYTNDEEKYYLTREWKKIDYDLLNNNIMNSDKYIHLLTDNDVDRVTINLVNEIQTHYNNMAPIIKVKHKNDDKVKLSIDTLSLLKKKDESYKVMRRDKTNENVKNFRILSKICRKRVIEEKNKNLKNTLEKEKNPKKLWQATKNHLYGNNHRTINRIMDNNKFILGSHGVTNVLNRFFIKKPKDIVKNLPINNIDPMEYYTKNVKKNLNKFSLKQVNISDIRKVMSALNKSKSFDYYGISMDMLYRIRRSIEPVLMNIVNLSIYNSIFPDILKINKIIPIPKDKDFLSPKNYRAINIFCPISKILEKCWSIQINKYLEDNLYLKDNHQGGVRGRGTVTATLNLNSKINKVIGEKKIAAVIGLDQSSCFEIIDHSILLKKLNHIGFTNQTVKLIEDFLSERKQYVEINTKCSDLLCVGNQSVFQGSVLSVTFYNIFCMDIPFIPHNIPNSLPHSSHYEYFLCKQPFLVSYIDDLFAIVEGNKDNIWDNVKDYMNMMKDYYTSNKLKINIDKTQIMLVGNKEKTNGNIMVEDKLIENKPSMKILGTIFSEDGKFNNNVTIGTNSLLTQIKRRSSAIIRIAKSYDIKFKSQLIHALLLGKIRYNIQTWGNVNVELKYKLNNIIQKTVERITNNTWFGRDISWRMKELRIPSYYRIFFHTSYKQTFKFINHDKTNMMNHILTKDRNIRLLAQGKCGSFNEEEIPSQISRLSFESIMRIKYNNLPRGITLSPNIEVFSKWLLKYHDMKEFDKYPHRNDNITTHIPVISYFNINNCY